MLVAKLPDIFHVHFRRHGVAHAVSALSAAWAGAPAASAAGAAAAPSPPTAESQGGDAAPAPVPLDAASFASLEAAVQTPGCTSQVPLTKSLVASVAATVLRAHFAAAVEMDLTHPAFAPLRALQALARELTEAWSARGDVGGAILRRLVRRVLACAGGVLLRERG